MGCPRLLQCSHHHCSSGDYHGVYWRALSCTSLLCLIFLRLYTLTTSTAREILLAVSYKQKEMFTNKIIKSSCAFPSDYLLAFCELCSVQRFTPHLRQMSWIFIYLSMSLVLFVTFPCHSLVFLPSFLQQQRNYSGLSIVYVRSSSNMLLAISAFPLWGNNTM